MKNNNISTSVDGVSKNRETHGVSETFVAKSKIDTSLEDLQRNGYTTLKNVFSEDECAVAKKKIDEIFYHGFLWKTKNYTKYLKIYCFNL